MYLFFRSMSAGKRQQPGMVWFRGMDKLLKGYLRIGDLYKTDLTPAPSPLRGEGRKSRAHRRAPLQVAAVMTRLSRKHNSENETYLPPTKSNFGWSSTTVRH